MSTHDDELKHWAWATQEAISDYCQKLNRVMNINPILGEQDVAMQKLNSKTESAVHSVVNAADHMFKAAKLASKSDLVDDCLEKLVHNLRNLREHWDENKKYFENSTVIIPDNPKTASARWFRKRFPDTIPWAGGWTNLCGYTAGPLYLGQLFEQANRLLMEV